MFVRLFFSTLILISFAACEPVLVSGQQAAQDQKQAGSTTKQQGSGSTETGSMTKGSPALMNPAKANLTAPATFKAKFATTKGDFVIEVTRANAPNGADRFYNMVKTGYFQDIAIFRAIEGFMFQFGIHGTPAIAQAWGNSTIKDDPFVGNSNEFGTISFAQTGYPNSRSSQMFINLGNNFSLDRPRQGSPFVPFGKVISGIEVVKKINTEYGENSREVQGSFRAKGNAYIRQKFPNIDFIKSVTVEE